MTEKKEMERITPEIERVTPEVERIAPEVERVTTEMERVTPEVERVTPEVERVTPEMERVTPEMERVTTEMERVTPEVERVTPEVERSAAENASYTPESCRECKKWNGSDRVFMEKSKKQVRNLQKIQKITTPPTFFRAKPKNDRKVSGKIQQNQSGETGFCRECKRIIQNRAFFV